MSASLLRPSVSDCHKHGVRSSPTCSTALEARIALLPAAGFGGGVAPLDVAAAALRAGFAHLDAGQARRPRQHRRLAISAAALLEPLLLSACPTASHHAPARRDCFLPPHPRWLASACLPCLVHHPPHHGFFSAAGCCASSVARHLQVEKAAEAAQLVLRMAAASDPLEETFRAARAGARELLAEAQAASSAPAGTTA